jgi:16S rRNA (uracil1498-N3)-methyltransferase
VQWTNAEARLHRLERIAVEAARQCGRGDVPEVVGPLSWSTALARAAEPAGISLCLWERATDPLAPKLRQLGIEQPVVFAIGAEGGLDDVEIEAARSLGYFVVTLGPFILRTETVAAAVLGAVLWTTA